MSYFFLREKLVKELETYKKSNEELRTMNTRYTKENEKFREKYTELDARIRDFENQNDQLTKDNDNFVERLDEMHVFFSLFSIRLNVI